MTEQRTREQEPQRPELTDDLIREAYSEKKAKESKYHKTQKFGNLLGMTLSGAGCIGSAITLYSATKNYPDYIALCSFAATVGCMVGFMKSFVDYDFHREKTSKLENN